MLLSLACAGSGEIDGGAVLAVDLNLHFAGAHFFWGDDRYAGAGKWAAPDVSRRITDGQVVIEIAVAQIAAAAPAGGHHAWIVVVDPRFVVGDAKNSAAGGQWLV